MEVQVEIYHFHLFGREVLGRDVSNFKAKGLDTTAAAATSTPGFSSYLPLRF